MLRWAYKIDLVVTLDTGNNEQIYPPYLVIEYRERERTFAEANPGTSASFTSEYSMDLTNFWKTVRALFITLNVVVALITFAKMYVWAQEHPAEFNRESYAWFAIYTGIIKLMETWSTFCFWFLFAIAGYWYIVFKL